MTTQQHGYKVGGSLVENDSNYVVRGADNDLYEAILAGEFCYIFNSRQMGKSSLRVRTIRRLQEDGVACATIDMTDIGSQGVTPQEWYAGIVLTLLTELELGDPIEFLESWWQKHQILSPVQQLAEFIATVLLPMTSSPIVIFIDEIDSVLSLEFPTNDFFALLRNCYEKRTLKPEYYRLTFVLIGVATPSDLIPDKKRTPFNIGKAIELNGFQIQEIEPLGRGLNKVTANARAVLGEILQWTGGQPFLTQKLCQLLVTSNLIPTGQESQQVKEIVESCILSNWESQDRPEHLKTIRDRILMDEENANQKLGLYRRILMSPRLEIPADGSSEQQNLRLSGLVTEEAGKLKVSNLIYRTIFNIAWVEHQLANLRPYAEAFKAWGTSNYEDDSWLLQGQILQYALNWASDKKLSDADYQFLSDSQELEKKREQEKRLAAENKLNQFLKKRLREAYGGGVVLFIFGGLAIGFAIQAQQRSKQAEIANINALNSTSEALFLSDNRFDALIFSLKAVDKLNKINISDNEIKKKTERFLRQAVYEIQEKNRLQSHRNEILSISFNPTQPILASTSADKTVRLWNLDGILLKKLEGHEKSVNRVIFSPDGRMLASASSDGTVKLWNLDGKLLKTLKHLCINKENIKPEPCSNAVNGISFSPDGQMIASSNADGTIELWNRDGKPLKTLKKAHDGEIKSVVFNPDRTNTTVAFASSSTDKTVRLWSKDGKLTKILPGHEDWVYGVNFSPDGKKIISIGGGSDRNIKLWSLNGTILKSWVGHTNAIRGVSFSPDGTKIASVSDDKTLKLWSSSDGTLLSNIRSKNSLNDVSFSPDGKTIASAGGDKIVRLWDSKTYLIKTLKGHQELVLNVTFSHKHGLLASAGADKTVKLWDIKSKRLISTLRGHKDWIFGISFSPDDEVIASSSEDQTIRLWRTRDGKFLNTLPDHKGSVHGVTFNPDGRSLVSAGKDGTIMLWTRNGEKIRPLYKDKNSDFLDISFSPNGEELAASTIDGEIKRWNKKYDPLPSKMGEDDRFWRLSLSRDGAIAAGNENSNIIKMWRRDNESPLLLQDHRDKARGVSFSPDGKILASASDDRTVKLWNSEGVLIKTLEGHLEPVYGVSFSPDGKILASASGDRTVNLWNINAVDKESLNLTKLRQRGCDWVGSYLRNNSQLDKDERSICDDIGNRSVE
jgi:WD40 repeat protein